MHTGMHIGWKQRGWVTRGCRRWMIGLMLFVFTPPSLQSQRLPTATLDRQERPHITLTVRNIARDEAIRQIAKVSGLALMWSRTDVPLTGTVSATFKETPVLTALSTVLDGTHAAAEMSDDGQTIIIVPATNRSQSSVQQNVGNISGRVVDSASGEGVSGASVSVQGTKLSTITDTKGAFTLPKVPVGEQTLAVKLLGYTSIIRKVTVAEQKTVTVRLVLREVPNMLSGVVTTATGAQRKLEVGHTVTTINVDSIIKVAPVMSVTDILESRVPGMTIQRTSGTPGDPARIRIRGAGSINMNNDPIIVVDGIRMYSEQSDARNLNESGGGRVYATPSPLDQIDVNTIETIEVLKGPSASAMYGSDAANGVIIVTTKRGRAGPPVWNLAAETGMTYQPGSWPTSRYQWSTPVLGGLPQLCAGFCGDAHVDSVISFQALNDPYLTVLGRGSSFGTSANVSGGSQTMTYNFSASMGRERGILKLPAIEVDRYQKFQGKPVPGWMRRPDLLTRRGGQGQVCVELSPKIGITAITSFNQSIQYRTSMSSSASTAINELQKRWVDLSQLSETPLLGNPYERVTNNTSNLTHSVELRANPKSWLPITGRFGVSNITSNAEMKIERGLLTTNESGGVLRGKTRTSSEVTGSSITRIPVMNRVDISAGLNFSRGNQNDQSGALFGIPTGVDDPSMGEDTLRNQFSRSTYERVSFGWFVEPRLNVRSRFFLVPGFRLDNNGLSGKNAKLNGLPKMNFSWVASEEPYFPWKELFQMVRVRSAFGVSGVQPRVTDQYRLYSTRTINPLGDAEPFYGDMLQLSNIGNTRIRPERVRELEGGVDIELLQNRLSLEVTHYNTRRKDAIVRNRYAESIDGGGAITMNIGDIEKSGTELSLQTQLLERSRVAFHVGLNFDRTRNKVLRLRTNDEDEITGTGAFQGDVQYRVGYPVEGTWLKPILGYQDFNQDGWISPSELLIGSEDVYVGTTEPRYKMGFHPRLSLFRGRINVAATVSYIHGQTQTAILSTGGGGLQLHNLPYSSSLVQGSDGFDRQVAYLASTAVPLQYLTAVGYTQQVNVARLQSLSLTANLGKNLVRWARARNASFSLQGSNLGLWTRYIGVDPNVNAVSADGRGFIDRGQQPEPRLWQLRISMGY